MSVVGRPARGPQKGRLDIFTDHPASNCFGAILPPRSSSLFFFSRAREASDYSRIISIRPGRRGRNHRRASGDLQRDVGGRGALCTKSNTDAKELPFRGVMCAEQRVRMLPATRSSRRFCARFSLSFDGRRCFLGVCPRALATRSFLARWSISHPSRASFRGGGGGECSE